MGINSLSSKFNVFWFRILFYHCGIKKIYMEAMCTFTLEVDKTLSQLINSYVNTDKEINCKMKIENYNFSSKNACLRPLFLKQFEKFTFYKKSIITNKRFLRGSQLFFFSFCYSYKWVSTELYLFTRVVLSILIKSRSLW